MDILQFSGSWKRQWRRRGYSRLSPARRSNFRTARFGGNSNPRRSWRVRIARKLRLIRVVPPLKLLLLKLKNSYMNMMIRLASTSHTSNSGNMFGDGRVPKARQAAVAYTRSQFENRLVQEIYKSMVASLELGYKIK